MDNINLVDTFSEFKELKNIDRETLMSVLEDVFRSVLLKQYGSDDNFDIIINPDKGDLEIWRNRTVVEDASFEDPNTEVTLSQAQKIDEDYEVGEDFSDQMHLVDFGRRAILTLRQNLAGRILELEKDSLYSKYKAKIGQIITGEVYQSWKREALIVDDEGNELLLPKEEQIPSEHLRKGDTVRAVVAKVEMKNSNPHIVLSRTSPTFLERLFELEVPEIFDGLITIKKIVRAPGDRAKVAVESYDERIDPVGACVGMRGSRIHGIVRELRNENVDIINYSTNMQLYVQRALNPAQINNVKIDHEKEEVEVRLEPDQVSLAIGKGGLNIRLASQLIGYNIEVFRDVKEEEEDVPLSEFSDEIDAWIIDQLKSIGCDTAKSVLRLTKKELIRRSDFEIETVDEIVAVLEKEFE